MYYLWIKANSAIWLAIDMEILAEGEEGKISGEFNQIMK